jgi:D-arabinose 1-dehydrogenase-like Zn-dependent alcohol dehydrogenase
MERGGYCFKSGQVIEGMSFISHCKGETLVDRVGLGGIVVQYEMTVGPKMDWLMIANLRNLELRGTAMGSRKGFKEMMEFVNEKIRPVVSRVVKGIDNIKEINGLFNEVKTGSQFSKLVIEIVGEGSCSC